MLQLLQRFLGGEKLQILQIPQVRKWLLAISSWLLAPYEDRFMSQMSSESSVSELSVGKFGGNFGNGKGYFVAKLPEDKASGKTNKAA